MKKKLVIGIIALFILSMFSAISFAVPTPSHDKVGPSLTNADKTPVMMPLATTGTCSASSGFDWCYEGEHRYSENGESCKAEYKIHGKYIDQSARSCQINGQWKTCYVGNSITTKVDMQSADDLYLIQDFDSWNECWDRISCNGNGCGYDSHVREINEGTVTLETAPAEIRNYAFVAYDRDDCSNGLWSYVYGGAGYAGTWSNMYLVKCLENSDCDSGKICDKSGDWDDWVCVNDPCASVTCNDYCSGDTRFYSGQCQQSNGQCSYSQENCASQNYYGDYVNYCSGVELRKHRNYHQFSCSNGGECMPLYGIVWTDDQLVNDCTFGCNDQVNQCNADPCTGVTCEDSCDGTTRYYNGQCSNGQCSYDTEENSATCGYDPCTGVTCEGSCDGTTRYYNGQCSAGECSYDTEENSTDCGYDPCTGVTCEDYCDGTTNYHTGQCSEGDCNYQIEENSTDCGYEEPETTEGILNPALFINDVKIFEYDGVLEEMVYVNDYSEILNDYLENCEPDENGICQVPIEVKGDSDGIIKLKDLNVLYEGGDSDEPPITDPEPVDEYDVYNIQANVIDNTVISGSQISKIIAKNSNIEDSTLTNCYVENSTLKNVDAEFTIVINTDLEGYTIRGADIRNGMIYYGTITKDGETYNADLEGPNMIDEIFEAEPPIIEEPEEPINVTEPEVPEEPINVTEPEVPEEPINVTEPEVPEEPINVTEPIEEPEEPEEPIEEEEEETEEPVEEDPWNPIIDEQAELWFKHCAKSEAPVGSGYAQGSVVMFDVDNDGGLEEHHMVSVAFGFPEQVMQYSTPEGYTIKKILVGDVWNLAIAVENYNYLYKYRDEGKCIADIEGDIENEVCVNQHNEKVSCITNPVLPEEPELPEPAAPGEVIVEPVEEEPPAIPEIDPNKTNWDSKFSRTKTSDKPVGDGYGFGAEIEFDSNGDGTTECYVMESSAFGFEEQLLPFTTTEGYKIKRLKIGNSWDNIAIEVDNYNYLYKRIHCN